MTTYFSEKLKVTSFLSIVIVLYLHAGYPDEVIATMPIPVIVRNCIVGIWGPCAVPMFYAISGYLFFHGATNLHNIYRKIRTRIRTLLIPFLIAALFFPLFFMAMELIPAAAEHINSSSYIEKFTTLPLSTIIKSLLYDAGNDQPWAYHLWFMRDLVIIIALSPILYYIRKWTKFWSIAIVLSLHFLFPQVSFLYAMYWFTAGSLILNKLSQLPKKAVFLFFGVFLALAIYRLFEPLDAYHILEILEISLGISSFWCLYDILVSEKFRLSSTPLLNTACQFTFFLYLYHEPGFHIIVKGIPIVLGNNWFGYTMSFLLSPIIMVLIGVGVGCVIKKYAPTIYGIIVGGR